MQQNNNSYRNLFDIVPKIILENVIPSIQWQLYQEVKCSPKWQQTKFLPWRFKSQCKKGQRSRNDGVKMADKVA